MLNGNFDQSQHNAAQKLDFRGRAEKDQMLEFSDKK